VDEAARSGLRNLARGVLGALVAGGMLTSCAAPADHPTAAPAAVRDSTTPSTTTSGVATPTAATPTAGVSPLRLRIPAIGVDTRLERLGVSRSGRLQPPVNPMLAGWFPGSSVPGQLGPAVIAGHRDSLVGPAVFWRLTDLRPGDTVTVTRSDGVTARFRVAQVQRVPRAAFPTEQVYGASPDRELRLITCGGLYDHVHGRYLDNVLVLALAV
jgi:LPXTG-site transpeptidase (sortase) family protein